MPRAPLLALPLLAALAAFATPPRSDGPIDVKVPHVSADASVKLDYDIVYVRALRRGDKVGTGWAEISNPLFMDPGADLMLLHPDGKEEVLVAGGNGSVADP